MDDPFEPKDPEELDPDALEDADDEFGDDLIPKGKKVKSLDEDDESDLDIDKLAEDDDEMDSYDDVDNI